MFVIFGNMTLAGGSLCTTLINAWLSLATYEQRQTVPLAYILKHRCCTTPMPYPLLVIQLFAVFVGTQFFPE